MSRIANIRVEQVRMDSLDDSIDVELEDNERIIRAVVTRPTGRGYSSGRDINIYILTDPVPVAKQVVGQCSVCLQDITKDQSFTNDHGVVQHNNPNDCTQTPYCCSSEQPHVGTFDAVPGSSHWLATVSGSELRTIDA